MGFIAGLIVTFFYWYLIEPVNEGFVAGLNQLESWFLFPVLGALISFCWSLLFLNNSLAFTGSGVSAFASLLVFLLLISLATGQPHLFFGYLYWSFLAMGWLVVLGGICSSLSTGKKLSNN